MAVPVATIAGDLDSLKTRIAKTIRGEAQTKVLDEAEYAVFAALDDINMRSLWSFCSKRAADYTLVAGTPGYSSEDYMYSIRTVQLTDFTTGKTQAELEFIPYEKYTALGQPHNAVGVPRYWTVLNPYNFGDDEIRIYPIPDAGAAALYKLRVEYYIRIAKPTVGADTLLAPRELHDLIINYGEYYILFRFERQNTVAWEHKWRVYRDKLDAFRANSDGAARGHNFGWTVRYADQQDTQFDPLR